MPGRRVPGPSAHRPAGFDRGGQAGALLRLHPCRSTVGGIVHWHCTLTLHIDTAQIYIAHWQHMLAAQSPQLVGSNLASVV